MPDPIALWHAEHVNFARLLDLLDRQLGQFHRGEAVDYEQILDVVHYMTHYPDLAHHPKEDLAFARLRARVPGVRPVVDELAAQHAQLRQLGDDLTHMLEDIVNGSIEPREQVEASGRAYAELFRRHMQREEAEILPLAERLLTAKDWAAIDAAIAHRDDPLHADAQKRYAALRAHLDG